MKEHKYTYTRLETDEEFIKRIHARHPLITYRDYAGVYLDDLVWLECQMQRRIIEAYA